MVRPCIAVIEDSLAVRRGLEFLLGDRGYHVVAHGRAAEAVVFVCRHQPALVIVDLNLEYDDAGLDVVRALRGEPATAHIPIVVWSADPEVGSKVERLGIDRIIALPKATHAHELLGAVQDLAAP